MKSRILYAIVFIALFFAPAALKAQTINWHAELDSCFGHYKFKLSVPSGNYNLATYYGDGTSDNTLTSGAALSTHGKYHYYPTAGTYIVKHVLLNSTTPLDSVQFSITTTTCNHARIRVYNDANSNCILDNGEGLVWALPASIEIDSAGVKIDTVVSNGFTYKRLQPGKTYTFKLLYTPLGSIATCPSNGLLTVTIPTTINTTNVDFGIQAGTNLPSDLAIADVHGHYRPTATSSLYVVARNYSISPKNATVTLSFSNKMDYVSSNVAPASVVGNVITWNVSNLSAMGAFGATITLQPKLPLTFNIGDTLCASASITPTSGDINLVNNTKNKCNVVVGSCDPNSKDVMPEGSIIPGTNLEYTIHFENVGTDTAFYIYVMDTLSPNVDANSVNIISTSHRASYSLLDGPNNRKIIRFEFPDIQLADASHKEANKGFIRFNINAKTGLAPLTPIENRAGIYFDINPVVLTNTALNWIKGLGVDAVAENKALHIYPNPNDGAFIIKADAKEYNTAKLMNSLGQVVAMQTLSGAETRMNVKTLPAGIYYMLLTGPAGSTAERIEKQ
jgi:uncharacterized repeat protein (TIGR01451 family)